LVWAQTHKAVEATLITLEVSENQYAIGFAQKPDLVESAKRTTDGSPAVYCWGHLQCQRLESAKADG